MIKTFVWYFKFFFTLVIKYPKLKKAEYLRANEGEKAFYDYCFKESSKWAEDRIKDSGANIFVYGKENVPKDKTIVFISNHQSDFDTAIFMALIPTYKAFLAKTELRKIPILRTWMEYTDCVFIERNNKKEALKTILQADKVLKKGRNLVIFPEGTRSKSSKLNSFKEGAFKIAVKNKVTIVPVTIDGSYKLKEKNKGLIRKDNVSVYIHKPIFIENLKEEELKNIHNYVENIIKSKISKE